MDHINNESTSEYSNSSGVGLSESSSMEVPSPDDSFDNPSLKIIEQPEQTFCCIKQNEMEKNKNNFLKGITSDITANNVTYPAVKLIGYTFDNDVIIICTPYCQNKKNFEIHPYRLVSEDYCDSKKLSEELMDPHKLILNSQNNTGIIKAIIMMPGKRSIYKRKNTIKYNKNFDLSKIFLKFEAFQFKNNEKGKKICDVMSEPIHNKINSSSELLTQSSLINMNATHSSIDSFNSTIALEIVEQPEATSYFRNESEVKENKHGHIKGFNNDKDKATKTFPTVQLKGYPFNSCALITCTPYCENKETLEKQIHPYRIVRQDRISLSEDMMDPYTCLVNAKNDFKNSIKATIMKPGKNSLFFRNTINSKSKYDLQKMILCFEAFEFENKIKGKPLCEPVFSDPIGNQRNVETNKLQIREMNILEDSVEGGTRAILLCERVPQDIEVRFCKKGKNPDDDFLAYGDIQYIHHQYTIVFNTPPYKDSTIKEPVSVSVQLERKGDGALSDEIKFVYNPQMKTLKRNANSSTNTSSLEGDNELASDLVPRKIMKATTVEKRKNLTTSSNENVYLEQEVNGTEQLNYVSNPFSENFLNLQNERAMEKMLCEPNLNANSDNGQKIFNDILNSQIYINEIPVESISTPPNEQEMIEFTRKVNSNTNDGCEEPLNEMNFDDISDPQDVIDDLNHNAYWRECSPLRLDGPGGTIVAKKKYRPTYDSLVPDTLSGGTNNSNKEALRLSDPTNCSRDSAMAEYIDHMIQHAQACYLDSSSIYGLFTAVISKFKILLFISIWSWIKNIFSPDNSNDLAFYNKEVPEADISLIIERKTQSNIDAVVNEMNQMKKKMKG